MSTYWQIVTVANGKLTITVEEDNGNYTSGKIQTKGLMDWTYGRFEIRAKLPNFGQGLWPAIWLLADACKYINYTWPKCGEIDIMERVNSDMETHSNTHTSSNYGVNGRGEKYSISNFDSFYIFALEWDNNAIKFFVRESTNDQNPIESDQVDFIIEKSLLEIEKGSDEDDFIDAF